MISNDLELEFDSNEPLEEVTLDLNLIKSKVPEFNSKKLCEMIVCDRYFGFNQDIAVMCMEELAKRRINGDSFDFETSIEDSLKELPPLNISGDFDIRAILNQSIGKK